MTLYLPPPLPLSALPSPTPPSLRACALSLTAVDIINTRRLSISLSLYLSLSHTRTLPSSARASFPFFPLSLGLFFCLSLTHTYTDHAIINIRWLSPSLCVFLPISFSFSPHKHTHGPCHRQHTPALSLSLCLYFCLSVFVFL